MELRGMKGRNKTKKDLRGEQARNKDPKKDRATRKLRLRCINQSARTHIKTNQCAQSGCFDWQQLHQPQMKMDLQC